MRHHVSLSNSILGVSVLSVFTVLVSGTILGISYISGTQAQPATSEDPVSPTRVFSHPAEVDSETITYRLGTGAGDEMPAGTWWHFIIPDKFRGRILEHALLRYRKNPKYAPVPLHAWDKNNAYLRFHIHDPQHDTWVMWEDQFGSEKRAAVRTAENPKKNTLYNCPELVGWIEPDMVALENRGEGDVSMAVATIHELTLVFLANLRDGYNASPQRVFDKPEVINSQSLRYVVDSHRGGEMLPGELWDFVIPVSWRIAPIQYAVLKHRKDPRYAINITAEGLDPNPAYILFQAHDPVTGYWKTWVDRYGSAKFSEIRDAENPEDETLHNCMKCLGMIKPDRVSLKNLGQDDPRYSVASIHEVELVFVPDFAGSYFIRSIYTENTAFFDLDRGFVVPVFGGGPRWRGQFRNAVPLGIRNRTRSAAIGTLPERHRFSLNFAPPEPVRLDTMGRLHIRLPAGEEFVYLELAVGDLDLTVPHTNKDGSLGRLGRAEINIVFRNSNDPGREHYLVTRGNVGKAGLIAAAPPHREFTTLPGDEIIVESMYDVAFLMGFRLTMRK